MKTAAQWIKSLSLESHPEGGYYTRIYESQMTLNTPTGTRPSSTAIHYLLERNDFSSWHRIQNDELWLFHSGTPLTVHQIDEAGKLSSTTLSNNHTISHVVKGKTWFCSEVVGETENCNPEEQYSLVSCVVSPGFDFIDFELGNKEELVNIYPQHRDIICRLCRS